VVVNAAVWIVFAVFITFVARRNPARNPGEHLPAFLAFCATMSVAFPFLVYLPELLCDAIARRWDELRDPQLALRRRARINIATKLCAAAAIRCCWMLPCLLLLRQIGVYPLTSAFWFSAFTTAWAAFNLLAALLGVAEMRRWNRWEGLDLAAIVAGDSEPSN
jgi:hypothetical protein